MDEISAGLAALGIDPSRIHTESFGPAASHDAGNRGHAYAGAPPTRRSTRSGPTIAFARSDLAIPWSADYASLLELAEACDVPVRWSCRTGVCHTCETTPSPGTSTTTPTRSNRPPAGAY